WRLRAAMYPVVATSTKAASKASANRATFCVLTALENVTATPLTDQFSAISTAGRPNSPAGSRTAMPVVEEPRTMSTARPVDSWMDAAARASRRSEAAVGPSIPRPRTRTALGDRPEPAVLELGRHGERIPRSELAKVGSLKN